MVEAPKTEASRTQSKKKNKKRQNKNQDEITEEPFEGENKEISEADRVLDLLAKPDGNEESTKPSLIFNPASIPVAADASKEDQEDEEEKVELADDFNPTPNEVRVLLERDGLRLNLKDDQKQRLLDNLGDYSKLKPVVEGICQELQAANRWVASDRLSGYSYLFTQHEFWGTQPIKKVTDDFCQPPGKWHKPIKE